MYFLLPNKTTVENQSAGYAVHGVYKIFFPYLVHIGKTSFLAFSTVTAALVNLVLNYFS